ncbi:MAG TPA: hypothetical protein VGM86_26600 [Thermoanaerobaculia bacterium]|jgi:hypothetical protein
MKTKLDASKEMVCLNGAAFRLDREAAQAGRLEELLDATLAQVFGGDLVGTIVGGLIGCTEFTCNMYAPK